MLLHHGIGPNLAHGRKSPRRTLPSRVRLGSAFHVTQVFGHVNGHEAQMNVKGSMTVSLRATALLTAADISRPRLQV